MTTYLRHGNENEAERQKVSLDSSKTADTQFLDFIEKNNRINKDDLIIDLGCGSGFFTNEIQKKFNCRVIGLDADSKQIESAKKLATESKNDQVNFINGLFFEDHAITNAKVVVMRQVIIDVVEQSKLLAWAATLLSSDGTVCTFEPDYHASILYPEPAGWAKFFEGYANYAINGTEDWYAGRKLPMHYHNAGLKILDMKTVIDLHTALNGQDQKYKKFIDSELFNFKVDMDGLLSSGFVSKEEADFALAGFEALKNIPYSFVQTQMVAVCGKR
jgi:ubiquinone/menaquinone biosynthesis C-methylase UbiE